MLYRSRPRRYGLEEAPVTVPFKPHKPSSHDIAFDVVEPVQWYDTAGGGSYLVVYWPNQNLYTVHDENLEPVDELAWATQEDAVRHINADLGGVAPSGGRRYILNGPVMTRIRALLGR